MKAALSKLFSAEVGLLLLILCTASALRFYRLGDFSLSNDELSALVRTEYSSFSELLDKGIRVDAHPAGVQVFLYYWTGVAGTSEFALRFPFALAGVVSVYVLFLLGRRWFGTTCGLVAAGALAVTQLPLLYSQLARPYAPGLLFTLLAAYWWTRLLFPKDRDRLSPLWTAVAFGLSLAACAYTHYFSMLSAGLIAFGGLPFLGKKSWRPYLGGCLLSVALFLPHLGIFFRQLSYGGVGEWLGKPRPGYFRKFLDFSFNYTEWFEYLFAVICLVSAALYYRSIRRPLLYVICLAWFLLPYFIGHWYSVHVNPVLQYSTLLFAFPWLLVFLSGFLDEEKTRPYKAILVAILLAAGIFTLVQQQYFTRNHFGVFSGLVSRTLDWEKQHGRENMTTVYNVNSPKYVGYYFNKFHATPWAVQYNVADDSSLARFRDVVDSSRTSYFVYGWSTIRNYPEAIELVRQHYPGRAARDTFFNSAVYLFGRDTTGLPQPLRQPRIEVGNDLVPTGKNTIKRRR